jgi:hypothetical protein
MPVICHVCIIAFVYGGSERNHALVRAIYRLFWAARDRITVRHSVIVIPTVHFTTVLQQYFITFHLPTAQLLAVTGSVIPTHQIQNLIICIIICVTLYL